MSKEQKDEIFPSGIYIFARILLFFFLYAKMLFQGKCLRILLLIRSGDIETNPGKKITVLLKVFSLEFKWTDFIKLSLTEAYIATNNFDIVCLSESFFRYKYIE